MDDLNHRLVQAVTDEISDLVRVSSNPVISTITPAAGYPGESDGELSADIVHWWAELAKFLAYEGKVKDARTLWAEFSPRSPLLFFMPGVKAKFNVCELTISEWISAFGSTAHRGGCAIVLGTVEWGGARPPVHCRSAIVPIFDGRDAVFYGASNDLEQLKDFFPR